MLGAALGLPPELSSGGKMLTSSLDLQGAFKELETERTTLIWAGEARRGTPATPTRGRAAERETEGRTRTTVTRATSTGWRAVQRIVGVEPRARPLCQSMREAVMTEAPCP